MMIRSLTEQERAVPREALEDREAQSRGTRAWMAKTMLEMIDDLLWVQQRDRTPMVEPPITGCPCDGCT